MLLFCIDQLLEMASAAYEMFVCHKLHPLNSSTAYEIGAELCDARFCSPLTLGHFRCKMYSEFE